MNVTVVGVPSPESTRAIERWFCRFLGAESPGTHWFVTKPCTEYMDVPEPEVDANRARERWLSDLRDEVYRGAVHEMRRGAPERGFLTALAAADERYEREVEAAGTTKAYGLDRLIKGFKAPVERQTATPKDGR